MKKISSLAIMLFLFSCSETDNVTLNDYNNKNNRIASDIALPDDNTTIPSGVVMYQESISCGGEGSMPFIIQESNYPITNLKVAYTSGLKFLRYVRFSYTYLNNAVADSIFETYNTPEIQQYNAYDRDFMDYVTSYTSSTKPLKIISASFGQSQSNAELYGNLFPENTFMNEDVVKTVNHSIQEQIKSNLGILNNTQIEIKAIKVYEDSTLCLDPVKYFKVDIAYIVK